MAGTDLASPANGDLAVLGDAGTVKPPGRECAREWPDGPPGAGWYQPPDDGTAEAATAQAGAALVTAGAAGAAPGTGAGTASASGTAGAGEPEPGTAAAAAAASSSAGAPPAVPEAA